MTGEAPNARRRHTAAVFLNGEYDAGSEFYWRRFAGADLRVAADGGYAALHALGMLPEVLVGDFDSLPADALAAAHAAGIEIVALPVRKDETDAEAAVDLALARGALAVDLVGALGGDLDHELGNLALLRRLARRGVAARLLAPALSVAVLRAPSCVALASPPGTRVSLLSLSEASVLTLDGLDYPLESGVLSVGTCLGVGNAVQRPGARIDVLQGEVLALVFAPDESFPACAESSSTPRPGA